MSRVLVLGDSGHARVVADILGTCGEHEIVGFVTGRSSPAQAAFGYSVLGTDDELPEICEENEIGAAFAAIGDNWVRREVIERAATRVPTLAFPSLVHPDAVVSETAEIGEGTVVMAGAVVNPGASVGAHCVVNTGATVDHDCRLGDYVSLAPGVTLGGGVLVGNFAAIGLGASVIHNQDIGEHSVVGAGAVVVEDVPSGVVAYGVPARVIRERQPGDPYL